MINTSELRKIVRFCRKNGIIKFKSGDFEIEIKEKPMVVKRGTELGNAEAATFPGWDSLTPEQKLLWSSTPELPTTSS